MSAFRLLAAFCALSIALPAMAAELPACPALDTPAPAEQGVTGAHALAIHGQPKYGADFAHFAYVNPDAPKGGTLRLGAFGGFDSLNPYIIKGDAAASVAMVYQTLLESSADEAFSEYGLLVQSITMPADRSFVEFTLRPEAKWQDGQAVTADDVVWSFERLKTEGAPFYQAYYAEVTKAEATAPGVVRFTFKGPGNRELPLIIGQLPVLPKHWFSANGRDFAKTSLEAPLGSGPYRVESVDPGRKLVLVRNADWWAKDLPINKGRYNFDRIEIDYYKDETALREAFLSGQYDFIQENTAKIWATSYDTPAVRAGDIVKEEIKHQIPTGMQGFSFNQRRPQFQDPRVRQAIGLLFDFEWSNKQFAYDAYTRSNSFFSNSDLASSGPPSAAEKAILDCYKGLIPEEALTQEYKAPVNGGPDKIRARLREALKLLADAGWQLKDGKLLNAKGEAFSFEILQYSPTFDRWMAPFVQNLKRVGIDARQRMVDTAAYQNRINEFDFDMIVDVFPQSLSPGNEQLEFWGSVSADRPGSRNTTGIKDPVVDHLIEALIHAPDRDALILRTKVLDRVLLWKHLLVPNWHIRAWRVAYWNKFGHPATPATQSLGVADTWWVDAEKAKALEGKLKE